MDKIANFRDPEHFPTWLDLPEAWEVNGDFYKYYGHSIYLPRKSWCYLGEIVAVEWDDGLILDTEDHVGFQARITFNTPDYGIVFAANNSPLEGNTVAVLYAHKCVYKDGAFGLRVEFNDRIKLIPARGIALLNLQDRVHEFCQKVDGKTKCHGCGKMERGMMKCAKCEMFSYCSKDCQTIGWLEKGHKADCKILRDTDVRQMFKMDWTNFDEFLGFPLA